MYSLKHAFTQTPEKVKTAVLAVVGVALALFTDLDPSLLETVGAGIALERLLDLFYASPQKAKQEEEMALKAIDLGKQLSPTTVIAETAVTGGPTSVVTADDDITPPSPGTPLTPAPHLAGPPSTGNVPHPERPPFGGPVISP